MKKMMAFGIVLMFCFSCFAQGQNNNSLLWRIKNNKDDNVSYLFGTIHLPQKKFVVYSDSVYEAIQNAKKFYNEVDLLNQSMFGNPELLEFFTEKGKYFDSIQKTDSWRRFIHRINKRYNVQLDPNNLMEFVEFGQKIMSETYGPEDGVTLPDMMLAQHALMLGKQTGGIETMLLQYKMIYGILDARLQDTTMALEDETNLMNHMKDFYLVENVDSIGKIVDNINPSYRKIVFYDRNKTMADSIEKYVSIEPSFFAVGVGHLGGNMGLITLLRKKGFVVTPILSKNKMSILVVNNMMKMSKENDEAKAEAVKIDLMDVPPPPPPKEKPPKVEMTPATKGKVKGKQ